LKKFALAVFYLVIFILFLAIFAPKEYLYYKIEHLLKDNFNLVISNESIKEHLLSTEIKKAKLFIKGIEIGDIKKAAIYPDILANALVVEDFTTNKNISLIPAIDIKNLTLFYTPIYPIKLFIKAKSNIGKIEGFVNLKERKVLIDIFGNPRGLREFIKIKRVAKGHYRYEFSY
jgi:hypothetical protein